MEVLLKSPNAVCLKRKLVDSYLTKDPKSRHVEWIMYLYGGERAVICGPHAHRFCNQPNLANDCVNYLQGSWCSFPEKVVPSLVDAFKGDKSSVVVVMDNQPLLVDFLSITLVNLNTRKQHSVSWLDNSGKWFFPTTFFDEEVDESTKSDSSIVEGSTGGINGDKVVKSPSEVVKQVVLETSYPVPQNSCTVEILHKKIVPVERGSESFIFVQNLFLSGMGSFVTPNSLHIHHYWPKHITAQCRLEAFERQYMLLFRAVLGNMGATNPGSQEGCPSTEIYDSGVDNCSNPSYYLIRTSHLSTHICLEYLVSFRLAPKVQGNRPSKWLIFGSEGFMVHPPKQGIVDFSTLQPIIRKSSGGPTSPWISFKVLFETIQASISPIARELLFLHYEERKDNKTVRGEMVKKTKIIVGEKLLLDTLTKHNCNVGPFDSIQVIILSPY
ncbi:hypothetical protein BAE44_0025388 [Dichanthelium oligosanthes]|uniref:RST domain-containing protein n=1 Tax=Dichanthelium oligosanthes TaxID=888268 RepID=A0A1E5UL48_9POAL|nr:hypothetical protein BAE44_0025388 [Dichanthelium oligosanthes]